MARKKHRVFLADDHPAMRESIAAAIQDNHSAALEVAGQAADGADAVEQVLNLNPDVVVLDLGMPRLGGLEALRRIKAARPETIVLIFSMYDDQDHVVEAIRAGADDYLFKHQARPEDVVAHVLAAVDKALPAQDALHETLFAALRRLVPAAAAAGFTRLTGAELEVLKGAAHHGWSMKEIAKALSGPGRSLSELTVRKHFEHIYEKLGARGQAHAVCLAIKHGLISAEPAAPGEPGS